MQQKITFDADRLYSGIVFHLFQPEQPHWEHVDQITPDSLVALYQRLVADQTTFSINRSVWANLSDVQRFRRLMKGAKTTFVFVGDNRETRAAELVPDVPKSSSSSSSN